VRWFSPAGVELTLCGHGTVAAAHVLAARGETPRDGLVFQARATGSASRSSGPPPPDIAWFEPDCPRWKPEPGDLSPFLAVLGLPAHGVAAWAPPARTSEQDLLIPVASLRGSRGAGRLISAGSRGSRRTGAFVASC
jgi:predicted PhzF superfamily epimerase YddE/YHI9